jgi:hypothetical protein
MFTNPVGSIVVDVKNGELWNFVTAAPNQLLKQEFNRATLKPGQTVVVTGFLAKDGQKLEQGWTAAVAATISLAEDGKRVFDRALVQ